MTATILVGMTYRVPKEWIERRRRMARIATPLVGLLGVSILTLALAPRVDWSNPRDRAAGIFVICIVAVGLLLGALAGRFSFRNTMRNWESLEIQLTPEEIVRQLNGQEVRIQRAKVTSIREYPQRGFVITDKLGWRIFVPKMVENYEDFRQRIVAWGIKSN